MEDWFKCQISPFVKYRQTQIMNLGPGVINYKKHRIDAYTIYSVRYKSTF